MASLKFKQIKQMNPGERKDKLKELRIELAKAEMNTGKAKMKNKEIKKAIARILMLKQH